ncbi:MAG: putative toxin-antitoxin system toxin component, PIN family, partial [Chloroflexota bacterium]|nr:putative toxin-antitoxin system toxin component, PIN family [Chloroflexota bacterium]
AGHQRGPGRTAGRANARGRHQGVIRAVLDTNVLASGFVGFANAERAPARLLHLWRAQRFELVISAEILTELLNTFADPYFHRRLTSEQIESAQFMLHNEATTASLTLQVDGVATHPEDDLVLALALSAGADYLVSGDKQLQRIGRHQGISVVSPRQFLALLEQDETTP